MIYVERNVIADLKQTNKKKRGCTKKCSFALMSVMTKKLKRLYFDFVYAILYDFYYLKSCLS